jgi:AmmeMemoRadiSam system protein B
MPVRKPAVAGSFYPSDPRELRQLIHDSYLHPLGPGRLPPAAATTESVVLCVSPHAGYVYSGPVAAHSYLHVSSLRRPELAIVVGPNHYGVGSGVSGYRSGEWETPLGRMPVDEKAAEELARATGILDFDPASHRLEHSLEVQLPFLQEIYGDALPLLPVCISFQDPETTKLLAEGVARVAGGRRTIVVASSDLTHYEPAEQARKKDQALLREVERMDVGSFYSTLERLQVTACGYGAIATVMGAAKLLGFRRGETLKYANSGDTTGDLLQVVGYGSVRFA